jgi:hypothetical protein
MRALLPVLTDQSTIIFILFCRHAQLGGENSHARGEGAKNGRRLAPESGLNPDRFVA